MTEIQSPKRLLFVGHSDQVELRLSLFASLHHSEFLFVDREAIQKRAADLPFDAAIFLGSDWSTVSGEKEIQISKEIDLVRSCLLRDIPVLGVCFGAQILSIALGGSVYTAEVPEIGWTEVHSNSEPTIFSKHWMQWHYDSIVLPPGATLLGENHHGVQAFRKGNAIGVQFHPEITTAQIELWVQSGGESELTSVGCSVDDLLKTTSQRFSQSLADFNQLMTWCWEFGN